MKHWEINPVPNHSICRRSLLSGLAGVSILSLVPTVARAQAPQKAMMAYGSTGYTWSTTFLAEAINAWKENGVDLNAVDFPSGRDAMQALLAGSAEFSTSTETPVIFAAIRGLKPIIVANYSRYSYDMKIVVRKDRNIDPNQPASLKGKKIATIIGTSGQYMLARYCEMSGFTIRDLTIVNMAPADMIAATTRGDIDGFSWTREAAISASRQSGDKTTVMTQKGLDKFFRSHELLLTTEQVAKQRPELIDAAVKSLFEAQEYMNSHPEWATKIASRVHNTPAEIREGTESFEFKIKFDEQFLDDLVTEAKWAIDAGLVAAPKDDLRKLFRGLIDERAVKKYHPDLVTIAPV